MQPHHSHILLYMKWIRNFLVLPVTVRWSWQGSALWAGVCGSSIYRDRTGERERFRIEEKNRAFAGRGVSHPQTGLAALRCSLGKGRVDGWETRAGQSLV